MSTKKPKVKSSSNRRKANAKLGYGETNKNVNTLRKIEKANSDENEGDTHDYDGHFDDVGFPEAKETRRIYSLTKKQIETGNTTKPGHTKRSQYVFGDVGTVYDKTHYPKSGKHWYLYYKKTKNHTGGFETRSEAIAWFENGGR